jgi:hypothetical protein
MKPGSGRRRRAGRRTLLSAAGPGCPGGDQQLPGGLHPDTGQRQQLRGNCGDQRGELGAEVIDLGLQRLPAAGQGAQRRLDSSGGVGDRAGAQRGAGPDPLLGGELAQRGADCSGAVRIRASSWAPAWMRAFIAPRRATRSTRIISTWASRDFGVPVARPDGPGGRLGVQWVGLAVAAPLCAVGPVDLDHGHAVVGQEPQQPGAEAASAFHTGLIDRAERLGPGRQLRIAAGRGREAPSLESAQPARDHRLPESL